MGFWDTIQKNTIGKVKNRLLEEGIDVDKIRKEAHDIYYSTKRRGILSDSGMTLKDYERLLFESAKKKRREKLTKPNTVASQFKLKDFLSGFKVFQEGSGIYNSLTDSEIKFLNSPNVTDQQANIYSKLKMLNINATDVYNTTILTDKDEDRIKEEYKDAKYQILSKEQYKKQLKSSNKGRNFDDNTINKYYQDYVNQEKIRKETYGNPYIGLTKELNQQAKQLADWTAQSMSNILSKGITNDTELLADFEQDLDDKYTKLIRGGITEAEAYGFPLAPDEGVAHQRAKTGIGHHVTDLEYAAKFKHDEQKMDTFLDEKQSELQTRRKEKIINQQGYNPNDYITDMFNDASNGRFEGFGTDDKGNTIYKFRSEDDDTDELDGLRGFNKWRKEGDFNELFYGEGGREKLEDLALTYAVLKEEQGEEEAKRWLQTRFQHYASEGISGAKQFENAVLGFAEDIIADAAEIVGAGYGLVTGVLEGAGGSIASMWNDSSLEDVWTEAMSDAFDNELTRWGAQLSSTGYYKSSWQQKANEIGFSYRDNIIDPDRKDFLFKGGGSGWGYFLSETGRQASHTMMSVWSGKILGSLGAKGGAALVKMLGGSTKAAMRGYRIGTTVGLAMSGSNEGVMDGIQVRDDIYRQGTQQVEQEIAERAIFDTLAKNVNMDDVTSLAQFLVQNHVGDFQTSDENGNTVTNNNLLQRDANGNLISTLNKRQLVDLLKSSEYGQQIIEQYKNREDVIPQYEEMKKQIRNTAIRNGAATALVENIINGSVRSFNAGARANIRGAEREFRRRMAQLTINNEGKASIKKVGAMFAVKQNLSNAKHEAIEEGLQAITQQTFTTVGENSIKRYIDNVYDTDTWEGFINEWSTTLGDIVTNAGAGLFKAETYEAAIQGAIGSMLGFFTFKQTGSGIKGLRLSWQGSALNIKGTVNAENEARKELTEALQNAINKKGGVKALMSMTSTKRSMDVYNNSIQNDPENKHANNELAVDALVHSVSTLHQIRDTEFGRSMMRNLMYQANILEEDVENSEMSEDELNRRRIERAKEFLTTGVSGTEFEDKKKAALVEVQTWLHQQGKNVRTVEEIAANPTEVEAQALVDIVSTAKQTVEMVDKISEIDASNSKNVQGLNFIAKNELNAKSLLLYNQQQRLQHANDRLTRIGEQSSPRSNTTLSTEQRQSVAVMGNSDEKRAEAKKKYEEEIENAKIQIKQLNKDLKHAKSQKNEAKSKNDKVREAQYKFEIAILETEKFKHQSVLKQNKEFLSRDKRTFWDIFKSKEETENIAEENRILTAYDIITLTPFERDMMLDSKNKDMYSQEQQTQIEEARNILAQNQALDLIKSTSELQASITANKAAINDVLTNIEDYNTHVRNAEQSFRNNVLEYRYETDITRAMDTNEVASFIERLNEDVKKGLLSEEEKNQLIQKATNNEVERNKDKDQNDISIKRGWKIYNQIQNQSAEIGNTFVNGNIVVDKTMFDDFMGFLRENTLTLQQFNDLNITEKQELLNNSKVLENIQGDTTKIDSYITFATDILHQYNEASAIQRAVNQDIARGNNDKEGAEDKEVQQPEQAEFYDPTQQNVRNSEMQNKRRRLDESSKIGSVISSIIGYIQNTDILQHVEYATPAKQILSVVKEIGMIDEPILSLDKFYEKVEKALKDDTTARSVWYEIRDIIDKREKEIASANARTSPTFRDRNLGSNPSSSVMHTERISTIRSDKTKKHIMGFLDRHSYVEATKLAAQTSQGSTGLGGSQIYYITDPRTTASYREDVGENYSDNKNLPIFACIIVSKDFNGAISVKRGNETIYVAPIGVLKEDTQFNNNASGMDYTNSIRRLAVEQQDNSLQPKLIMANDMPLTSEPQNHTNYLITEEANDFTGRRSITDEIKGFGNQVTSAINSIISRLKVGKIGDKDYDQIYYDNGSPAKTIPIAKQAGLNELVDASEEATVAEILNRRLDREIDNPIIRMFYRNVLGNKSKNSLVELIKNKDDLLRLVRSNSREAINELNDKINKTLSLSFYPANYKGERYWKYQINVEGLLKQNPEFILEVAPVTNNENENSSQAKAITLLDFTNLFDEAGELQLTTPHANAILQHLIFDSEGKIRHRGDEEYGNSFATVQASMTVVKHANGEFTEEEINNTTEAERTEIQERNHSVLSAIIEGGGLIIEGPINNAVDYAVLVKPASMNKQGAIAEGAAVTGAQMIAESKLNDMMGGSELDTIEDKDKKQVVNRKNYIEINKFKNKKNKEGSDNSRQQHSMYVTTLAKWVSGGFKKVWGNRKTNPNIPTVVGSNADLIFRHILWTSEYNRDAERDSIKKIPLDFSQYGEEYYTDQELEQQFGFKAADIKSLALAFTISLNQLREEKKFTFYTNVVKPKTDITVTDGEKSYKIPVAGELDLLAIGPDGTLHPIDFKTVGFNDIGKQEFVRSNNIEERISAIKNEMLGFEGYTRQINIYQAGLNQQGFKVGEGYILAVPVAYTNDFTVEPKLDDNSEYGNATLVRKNVNGQKEPFLEGLEQYQATDSKEPFKLTYIPIEYNSKFTIDMEDVLAMSENDINFLRRNPEFADAIDRIMEMHKANEEAGKKPNKVAINLTVTTPKKSGEVRVEGNKAVWEEDDEFVTVEEQQTIGNTNANFNEIDRQIASLKSQANFNEDVDTIQLIVGEESFEFTVKQLEDFKENLKKKSEKEGLNAEEQLEKLTVNDLCTALSCGI